MDEQHTVGREVRCEGRGLHGGAAAALALAPAPPGTGLVFVRRDLGDRAVPVRPSAIASLSRATSLARGDAGVATVEHLLAALYAFGIDNARIEIDGPEVPVLDGSAAPFAALLREAGRAQQRARRRRLRLAREVAVDEGERWIRATPGEGLAIRYAIDFAHPAIGRQELAIESLDADVFERELAFARTFGFLHEVDALRRAGLGLGGSLDNTVVLDAERVLNPGGLRRPDEFVRHKALDLVGDLALLGAALDARVEVHRGGHALHQRLVAALLAEAEAAAG